MTFDHFLIHIMQAQTEADMQLIRNEWQTAEANGDITSTDVYRLTLIATIALSAIHWKGISRAQQEALNKLHHKKPTTNTNIGVKVKSEKPHG